jgi:hypothetical protein
MIVEFTRALAVTAPATPRTQHIIFPAPVSAMR